MALLAAPRVDFGRGGLWLRGGTLSLVSALDFCAGERTTELDRERDRVTRVDARGGRSDRGGILFMASLVAVFPFWTGLRFGERTTEEDRERERVRTITRNEDSLARDATRESRCEG